MWSEEDDPANDKNNSDDVQEMPPNDVSCVPQAQKISGRERSLSVPCQNEAADVETVVTKARLAASFLWMLLHSQVCLIRLSSFCAESFCCLGHLFCIPGKVKSY
jgi:hypothetical protein